MGINILQPRFACKVNHMFKSIHDRNKASLNVTLASISVYLIELMDNSIPKAGNQIKRKSFSIRSITQ